MLGKCCEHLVWVFCQSLVPSRFFIFQMPPCHLEENVVILSLIYCMDNAEVELHSSLKEIPSHKLVFWMPIHCRQHIWWYYNHHSSSLNIETLRGCRGPEMARLTDGSWLLSIAWHLMHMTQLYCTSLLNFKRLGLFATPTDLFESLGGCGGPEGTENRDGLNVLQRSLPAVDTVVSHKTDRPVLATTVLINLTSTCCFHWVTLAWQHSHQRYSVPPKSKWQLTRWELCLDMLLILLLCSADHWCELASSVTTLVLHVRKNWWP